MYTSVKTYTVSCAEGTSGTEVSRTAVATSLISQRDADVKATGMAKMLAFEFLSCAFPDDPAVTVYYSLATSASSSAQTGYATEEFTVELAAGAVYSTVSQAAADVAAGLAAQAQANDKRDAEQRPIYYNDEQSRSQSCGSGYLAYTATATVPAGAMWSLSSKAQANADALAQVMSVLAGDLTANCVPFYLSEVQSYTATCTVPGEVGEDVTVTNAAGHVVSLVSVADANATSLADATASAEGLIVCTAGFYNAEQSYTATCLAEYGFNWSGDDVTVTIPAGEYFAALQATADSDALAAATAQAIAALVCYWGGGEFP